MLLLNLILLIDVTFSTPTDLNTQIPSAFGSLHIGTFGR